MGHPGVGAGAEAPSLFGWFSVARRPLLSPGRATRENPPFALQRMGHPGLWSYGVVLVPRVGVVTSARCFSVCTISSCLGFLWRAGLCGRSFRSDPHLSFAKVGHPANRPCLRSETWGTWGLGPGLKPPLSLGGFQWPEGHCFLRVALRARTHPLLRKEWGTRSVRHVVVGYWLPGGA